MNTATPCMEQHVTFPCNGKPLFGILHRPEDGIGPGSRLGMIMVNAGIRSRRGPNRLYVRFARRLSRAGYYVLRYDPPGIGDSPGQITSLSAYRKAFLDCSDSTTAAIDYFKGHTDVTTIGLTGICGGAYSAMVAAAADHRVELMILASLPVQQMGEISEKSTLGMTLGSFLRKAGKPQSYYRFLTGKSQYRWILKATGYVLSGHYRSPDLDVALWEANKTFLSAGRPILYIYGTEDPLYQAFRKEYQGRLKDLDPTHRLFRIHLIQNGNHSFTQIHWQEQLVEASLNWLRHHSGPQ